MTLAEDDNDLIPILIHIAVDAEIGNDDIVVFAVDALVDVGDDVGNVNGECIDVNVDAEFGLNFQIMLYINLKYITIYNFRDSPPHVIL